MYQLYLVCATLLCSFGNTTVIPFERNPLRLLDMDVKEIFFDRVVTFTLDVQNYIGDNRLSKNVAEGVLIDKRHVLTSFNPFRNLTKSKEMLDLIYVCFLTHRRVDIEDRTYYTYECAKIECGRPVVPMNDDEILEDQWHGPDKKHSPLHDLMVVRLSEDLDIWEPERDYTYEERHTQENKLNNVNQRAGPLLTKLANRDDKFSKHIQFASLGLKTPKEMRRYHQIELAEFEDSENIEVSCDDWLPRNWGHFFCLANDNNKYPGFASSALLFSRRRLFGVGSFTLWRGSNTIIVFTDIRPYLDHISKTCTKRDLF